MDDDSEKGVVEDELLLGNIVDLLKSEDEVSIISTCEFLQTVVIYDFPADAFLNQRTLVQVKSLLEYQMFLKIFKLLCFFTVFVEAV